MDFLLMVQMLTRIPVKRELPCAKEDFRRASAWFGPVGLLLGALSLLAAALGSWLLGRPLGAAAYTLTLVLLTGALHNDGLADCFDAFFCFRDREGMLAILKDSRMGAYGTLALVFDVGLRTLAVAALPQRWLWFLLVVPVLGRACTAWAAAVGASARPGGSGALFIGNVPAFTAACSLACALMGFTVCGFALGGGALALAAAGCAGVGFLAAWAFFGLCNRKLGGLTGDCLGGCCELAELASLLALVVVAMRIG